MRNFVKSLTLNLGNFKFRDITNQAGVACENVWSTGSALVDINGGMINDPLVYKLKDDLWRNCIADSDVLLFAKGIAAGKKLNSSIFEANIDTLAIQGPKSFKLMEEVFGPEITRLKFFKYDFLTCIGITSSKYRNILI